MLSVGDVTTYREGNMFWAAASKTVDVSAADAWTSLDPLLIRIVEIPRAGHGSTSIVRVKKSGSITEVGNRIVSKAGMLGGVIKATMSMKVMESEPLKYLRLDVQTYNMSFAEIDFRIDSLDSGCRLTFRQGFRSRKRASESTGEAVGPKACEMPETARIFKLWLEAAGAS